MSRWHVVGGGLAGLAAATAVAGRGEPVVVYEAAGHAGGRCRSLFDARLGLDIDNGNHLILSGNRAVVGYLDRIAARDRFREMAPARFPFVDLATGERWSLRPGRGPLPLWLADPARRPPGLGLRDVGRGLGLLTSGKDRCVGDGLRHDAAYDRFWDPLITAVVNTPPDAAAAALMRPVLLETFARGEPWCRPLLAARGLGDALVDPAVAFLAARGAEVRLGARVRELEFTEGTVTALHIEGELRSLGPDDRVILATPPWITASLVPGLAPQPTYSPILNVHFRLPDDAAGGDPFLGLVGGLAQWIFRRGPLVSVTVSAAAAHLDTPKDELAERIWQDVRRALDVGDIAPPPSRVITEKRATPLQTPRAVRNRWSTRTRWRNLALAGDWIATGLPATIESAVRSGEQAVTDLRRRRRRDHAGTDTQRTA